MCSSVSCVYGHTDVHDHEVEQLKESMVPAPKEKKAVAEKKVVAEVCPKIGVKTKFGAGGECWQCIHLARGGKGGHKHTCGKTAWKR